jgi:hypothetical protein
MESQSVTAKFQGNGSSDVEVNVTVVLPTSTRVVSVASQQCLSVSSCVLALRIVLSGSKPITASATRTTRTSASPSEENVPHLISFTPRSYCGITLFGITGRSRPTRGRLTAQRGHHSAQIGCPNFSPWCRLVKVNGKRSWPEIAGEPIGSSLRRPTLYCARTQPRITAMRAVDSGSEFETRGLTLASTCDSLPGRSTLPLQLLILTVAGWVNRNQQDVIAFATVPTGTFRVLFVLLVLGNDRRRVLHVNVTAMPNAAWTGLSIPNQISVYERG